MAGRWTDDDRERDYWRRERRYDQFGLDDESRGERSAGREERSWSRDRDRVFGEEDYGAGYNRPQGENWQSSRYGGVSPAMRRGEYEAGYGRRTSFSGQDYTGGGRYYGDDGYNPVYRSEYGQGGREYGAVPRGYDEGRRFGSRQADERWEREMRRPIYGGSSSGGGSSYSAGPTYSGGTGGYDYERGYGNGGQYERAYENRHEGRWADRDRYEGRTRDEGREGFEDRARDAGESFRRMGRKISNFFSGEGRDYDEDRGRSGEYRGARGLGPKGYTRSDDRISEEAHQRLTDDPWVDASEIACSVSSGEVTLSGTVDNREAKHRAERVVEDISGVKHVQNNLRIKPGNYFTSPGRGYGDSVEATQMRNSPVVQDVTNGGTGTTATTNNGEDSAATRTTTRRT